MLGILHTLRARLGACREDPLHCTTALGCAVLQGGARLPGQAGCGSVGREGCMSLGAVCDRQYVSVTYSLCLSQTVCVRNIQSVSFTDSMCLSQTVCVYHRQFVFVTDCLFPSQTVSVCHRQPLSVTGSLHLSQTLFLIILALVLAYLYVNFIKICP